MAHFFIAKTHNNLCLALGVIQQEKLIDCHIFYFNQKNKDQDFLELFEKQVQGQGITVDFPYDKPVTPQDLNFMAGAVRRRVYNKRIKSLIGKYRNKKVSDSYYFFDDTSFESQYINRFFCKKDSKTYLVQTETSFYVSTPKAKESTLKVWLQKARHGFYFKDLTTVGDLRKYDALFCLKPEFLLDSYKNLTRVVPINVKYLYNVQWKNISIELFNRRFRDFFSLGKEDILIFLPQINRKEEAKELQIEILHRFSQRNQNLEVFVKNHSNSKFRFNSYDIRHGMQFIPDGIPEECFFAFNSEKSLNYYLAPGSSLVLAKINFEKATVKVLFEKTGGYVPFTSNQNFMEWLKS